MDAFDEKLTKMKSDRKELKKRLAGGDLPKRAVAVRHGSSASSLRVGGRRYSSREVQRVVEAHDREGNDLPFTNGAAVNTLNKKTSRDSGVHM